MIKRSEEVRGVDQEVRNARGAFLNQQQEPKTRIQPTSRGMRNELLHFSEAVVREVRRPDLKQTVGRKPVGFWVSVGPEWMQWCMGEDFHIGALRAITRVVLKPDANILRLKGAKALDLFTMKYGVDRYGLGSKDMDIDWPRVTGEYDGIIIAPYCHARRFELSWYYGWDVASGCIWNPAAIESLDGIDLTPAFDASLKSASWVAE